MPEQWYWQSNGHLTTVTVFDYDGKDCLVTVNGVKECFYGDGCNHWTILQTQLRLVPAINVQTRKGKSYWLTH